MTRTLLLLGLLVLTSLACRQPAGDEPTNPSPEPAAASDSGAAAEAEPAVEFEPAYPTDVSSEELSETDVAQQRTHSHGEGEEHSHDDADHEHAEDEAHDDHRH